VNKYQIIYLKIKSNKYAVYKTLEGIVNKNKNNKGIPQGSPVSGLLANIYLIDFDNDIKNNFPDVFYRRYSDDLVFVCRKDQRISLLEFIDKKIKDSLLHINSEKSFISYFKKDGGKTICEKVTNGLDEKRTRNYVDYLGLEFCGEKIFLRKNTIQKLKYKQVKKAIKQLKNTQRVKRKKPKKLHNKVNKNRNNYFKRTLEIVSNSGVKNQVLKVTRDRNELKNKARLKK